MVAVKKTSPFGESRGFRQSRQPREFGIIHPAKKKVIDLHLFIGCNEVNHSYLINTYLFCGNAFNDTAVTSVCLQIIGRFLAPTRPRGEATWAEFNWLYLILRAPRNVKCIMSVTYFHYHQSPQKARLLSGHCRDTHHLNRKETQRDSFSARWNLEGRVFTQRKIYGNWSLQLYIITKSSLYNLYDKYIHNYHY